MVGEGGRDICNIYFGRYWTSQVAFHLHLHFIYIYILSRGKMNIVENRNILKSHCLFTMRPIITDES